MTPGLSTDNWEAFWSVFFNKEVGQRDPRRTKENIVIPQKNQWKGKHRGQWNVHHHQSCWAICASTTVNFNAN